LKTNNNRPTYIKTNTKGKANKIHQDDETLYSSLSNGINITPIIYMIIIPKLIIN